MSLQKTWNKQLDSYKGEVIKTIIWHLLIRIVIKNFNLKSQKSNFMWFSMSFISMSFRISFSQDAFDEVVKFFGENSKTTPPSVFFPVFVRFVKAYRVKRPITCFASSSHTITSSASLSSVVWTLTALITHVAQLTNASLMGIFSLSASRGG